MTKEKKQKIKKTKRSKPMVLREKGTKVSPKETQKKALTVASKDYREEK